MDNKKLFTGLQWTAKLTGLISLFFTLVYGKAGVGFVLLSLAIILAFEYFFAWRKNNLFNPYSLMIFSPLLLLEYSSITDFRIRVLCFMLLNYVFNAACKKSERFPRFSLLGAKPATIWLTAAAIFALASAAITWRGIRLSGDEPHYIMITQSLVEDGDFDLKNNMDEKTYYKYLPIDLRFHGGDYNGKYRSFHLPGVSFLLIPFYWLFHVTDLGKFIPPSLYFRLAASVINAFFALGLFYILKMKFPDRDITRFWLLFLFLFPLIFHCTHLYPELPAAALMMGAYLFTFSHRKNYLWAGLFLAFIPWFHVKYIPPMLVLTLAILYRVFKPLKPSIPPATKKIQRLVLFFIFPVTGFILLSIYCKTFYGSFSPTAVFPQENYWSVPWLLRLKVFLAYFWDQRDGLLSYGPVFFLFFFSFKKKWDGKYLLLAIAFIYVFFHAFTTVRGAYAPAGRPLVFAGWIFIVFMAHFYFRVLKEKDSFLLHFAYRVLVGLTLFVSVWLFYYPLFVYQPVFAGTVQRASGINLFLGSDFIHLWRYFPSFLTGPRTIHPANFVWAGIIPAALAVYYLKPRLLDIMEKPGLTRPGAVISPVLFLAIAFLYCFYPHVHLLPQNKHIDAVIAFYNNSGNFQYVPGEKRFRIKAGNNYDIFVHREMNLKDEVMFHFKQMEGNDLIIRNGKRLLYRSKNPGRQEVFIPLRISSLSTLKVGNKRVSHIGIETQTRQGESFLWLEIR